MRIGELAARAEVSPKAVRYYESVGLLRPARRPNGYRDYTDDDLRLVRELRGLRELGITGERARPFLDCLASGQSRGDDCPASLAAYQAAIEELTARIDALAARRAALVAQLRAAAYRGFRTVSHPSASPPPDLEANMPTPPANALSGPIGPPPDDDGRADHLPGRPVPALSLPATDGRLVALDQLGPGRTVVYLYPLTRRPDVDLPEGWATLPGAMGCTPEACGFRDHLAELLAAGADAVFGLSSQDTDYQRELVERLRLPFPMLADPGLAVAAALDLPTFTAGGMTLYKRLTMIINSGVVEHVFYPVYPPDRHAEQVRDWLRGAAR